MLYHNIIFLFWLFNEFVTTARKKKCPTMLDPISWSQLNQSLQTILPSDEEWTYVVENYQEEKPLHFEGAPKINFHLVVRINLKNADEAKAFLDKNDDS